MVELATNTRPPEGGNTGAARLVHGPPEPVSEARPPLVTPRERHPRGLPCRGWSDPASRAHNPMTAPVLQPMAAEEIRAAAASMLRFELHDLDAHLGAMHGTPMADDKAKALRLAFHHLDSLRAALQALAR